MLHSIVRLGYNGNIFQKKYIKSSLSRKELYYIMAKMIKKVIKVLSSRLVIIGVILLLQVSWFVIFIEYLGRYSTIVNLLFKILSIIVVLWLVNKNDNPAYKLAWVIPILLYPLLGGMMYLFLGDKKPNKVLRQQMMKNGYITNPLMIQDESIMDELKNLNKSVANQSSYISNIAKFPIYKNTISEYYKTGEEYFINIKEELKKAKHFIFLEYFIIEEGIMWGEVLSILEEKVRKGVEIRLIYDDVGCLPYLPYNYYKKIEKRGIKCISFNKFKPIVSTAMNHRDHRKILVIDGNTAFTGGINMADEYINEKKRFGYWKDTGIIIKGDAVWNFTIMFLQMWNSVRPTDHDYLCFKPNVYPSEEHGSDGYIQPYGDSPLDTEAVGENVYLNIINNARDYVYIFTPYLIIDNEMMTALCLAAKKGVDVRIVTPGIPDKKYVFWLTQSYYSQLAEAGVRIYEYTPGFLHAKCFVCDDEIATVGTINMDYRSLFLHFECGVFLYKAKAILKVKEDVLNTLNESKEITKNECKRKLPKRLMQVVLRLFAPLM